MGKRTKLRKEEIEFRIIQAAKEQFSRHGFYAARMDAIAEAANVNKRIVYEFARSKEELYLTVLSELSRHLWSRFDSILPKELRVASLRELCSLFFELMLDNEAFQRLLMWERMKETIHGVRILETANAMSERVEAIMKKSLEQRCFCSDVNQALLQSSVFFLQTTVLMLFLQRNSQHDLSHEQFVALHLQTALSHIEVFEREFWAEGAEGAEGL